MLAHDVAEVLPQLQAHAESLMTDTCVIEAVETGSDDDGFTTTTTTAVYSGKCRVQTFEPHERTPEVGGGTQTWQRYHLHVPVSVTGVEVGHMVTHADGRMFRVAGLHNKTLQTAQRLLVELQTGGVR